MILYDSIMNEDRLFFSYCHVEKERMDEIVPLVEAAGVPVCGMSMH